jgi:hypothetical protein
MPAKPRTTLDRVKWLVWLYRGWTFWLSSGVAPQLSRHETRIRGKDCGGALCVIIILNSDGHILMKRLLPDHARSYPDSG